MTDTPQIEDRTFDVSTHARPDDGVAKASAAVIHGADRNGPLRIRISVGNGSDETRQFGFGQPSPFAERSLEHCDGDGVLVVVAATSDGDRNQRYVPAEPLEKCWQAIDIPDRLDGAIGTVLAPGDSIERDYDVLNHPNNSSCFPPGHYVGTDTVRVGEPRAAGRGPGESEEFRVHAGEPHTKYEVECGVTVG